MDNNDYFIRNEDFLRKCLVVVDMLKTKLIKMFKIHLKNLSVDSDENSKKDKEDETNKIDMVKLEAFLALNTCKKVHSKCKNEL